MLGLRLETFSGIVRATGICKKCGRNGRREFECRGIGSGVEEKEEKEFGLRGLHVRVKVVQCRTVVFDGGENGS